MTTDPPEPPPPGVDPTMGADATSVLSSLRDSMNEAREAVMVARRPPAGPTQLKDARGDYLATMLAYEQALNLYRLPVPRRLHDDIRLMRRLVSGAGPAVTARYRPSGTTWRGGRHGQN
ncbi:hypothetical protein [Intrasporangium sp.]|uniref:hypothetical protein n=1 Tax=Intrasporangium sp. TaxID=1925024 RepID=UPI00293A1ED6|nr:hypothetical protein [Intrasporangium sp.]MDV3223504.1 hypothetical protein [Intrasporangium sp.]